MDSKQIREKYIKFFVDRGHAEIAPAKLVPENDSSTLFTSSGMQQLIPYLLGEEHPAGKRLVDSQPSFRAEDIEEVGDNRHTTFFEMLGNWSLGDYFKKEQLPWIWEFLTKELNIPKEKLYVSVFEGNESVPKDNESFEIWKNLGLPEDHIYFYGVEKNWWSRSGSPEKMPEGEIGGPDSEIFYEFTEVEHDPKYGEKCHPNCDCGRFLEIGNSVFIQYQKQEDGSLKELLQKNVDFGGGLERLTAAINNTPDVFETDLYLPIIRVIEKNWGHQYKENSKEIRIIADHIKAAVMLISDGVMPGKNKKEAVLKRLIKDSLEIAMASKIPQSAIQQAATAVIKIYENIYPNVRTIDKVREIIAQEWSNLERIIPTGPQEVAKMVKPFGEISDSNALKVINYYTKVFGTTPTEYLNKVRPYESLSSVAAGTVVFSAVSSKGLPEEYTEDLIKQYVKSFVKEDVNRSFKVSNELQKELSRTASSGMFKGGLADHSEIVTKYHTATHLLQQALRDVLGSSVFQKGSNINSERLRFDFSFDRKMTDEEIKLVEEIINKKIEEDLKVEKKIVNPEEAKDMGAMGLFSEKYGAEVSVYGIGPDTVIDPSAKDQRERSGYYSLEFCGGPHVEHTGVIGKIKITKEEAVSSGIRRIRAQILS